MRGVRRCKFGPLTGFTLLALLGFIFFTSFLGLVGFYPYFFNDFLKSKNIKNGLDDVVIFIVLSVINAVGFLGTFIQLMLAKPSSKKVLVPVVLFTLTTFIILIALDFYLEVQMTHLPPKQALTKFEKTDEKSDKKEKGRFKMGYLIIYVSFCIVTGFIYLAFKDFEEYLTKQKNENTSNEIIISHIT